MKKLKVKDAKGYYAEASIFKDFHASSFKFCKTKAEAKVWIKKEVINEIRPEYKVYHRIKPIKISFCLTCKSPIGIDELYCLRCDEIQADARLEAQDRIKEMRGLENE